MRVTAIQMNPGHEKSQNIAQAERLCEAAIKADRPDLIALPEMWTMLGGDRESRFGAAETLPESGATAEDGPASAFLSGLARRHAITVHGGSIAERAGNKLQNTSLVFGPDGTEIARYRKIHLFDITAPDGTAYRESDTYAPGREVVTYEAQGTVVGAAVCYDVRFSELFLKLRAKGAEVIMLPSAFTVATGKDHWEVLIRARAIETQCWMVAPATWGKHEDRGQPRFTYGHTLICDPWGHVVAKASDGPGWCSARIDATITEKVRRDMPVLEHRVL